MDMATMGTFARWKYAAKLNSWPKLLVPFLLGQSIGVSASNSISLSGLLIGGLFTIFILLFIVFMNDWADETVDRIKRSMFPEGCTPKTIPDNILSGNDLLIAGTMTGAAALGITSIGEMTMHREYLLFAGIACLLIFVSYSLPPIRLNYRGGGELLEMLGVGVALPVFNIYCQSGEWLPPAAGEVLPAFMVMALASAIASGLSDEESDRKGGKTTLVTMFGNRSCRRAIEFLLLVAVLFLLLGRSQDSALPALVRILAIVIILWYGYRIWQTSDSAKTNAFKAQAAYKNDLHLAIWFSSSFIAVYWIWGATILP